MFQFLIKLKGRILFAGDRHQPTASGHCPQILLVYLASWKLHTDRDSHLFRVWYLGLTHKGLSNICWMNEWNLALLSISEKHCRVTEGKRRKPGSLPGVDGGVKKPVRGGEEETFSWTLPRKPEWSITTLEITVVAHFRLRTLVQKSGHSSSPPHWFRGKLSDVCSLSALQSQRSLQLENYRNSGYSVLRSLKYPPLCPQPRLRSLTASPTSRKFPWLPVLSSVI